MRLEKFVEIMLPFVAHTSPLAGRAKTHYPHTRAFWRAFYARAARVQDKSAPGKSFFARARGGLRGAGDRHDTTGRTSTA